ncbi:MAG: formate--tetrahydrofolate ligase [Planctomycetes bacterium SM23_65]|nr:MAG: formate--tetrahydrofolate ligase [Planctomycetes bacterium SM23_65]
MVSDLEIAQQAKLEHIKDIAEKLGVKDEELELYGNYKAKVTLGLIGRLKDASLGKYIDVTAITPTPLGEGKTVTTIGLSQGLAKIGKNVCTCIRQPSLGPVFGIKGGAAGGGHSQVVPMEDFNLHLTGDVHAVGLANNLACAFIDNNLFHQSRKKPKGRPLDIDPDRVLLNRVLDVSDRALREITIAQRGEGIERQASFDITVASEVMAILALTTSLKGLRERLGRMVVAYSKSGKPVTCDDLGVAGSMAALLKDAIKPNLMQTLEHTPCFVHAGPFANIAHGNSSIIADQMATRLADYTVTESGFGADCGMEKFLNIKCRYSGLIPHCVVVVATVRALKMHSGGFKVVPGHPLPKGLTEENIPALEGGMANLVKHIENVNKHGVQCVVAVNRFTADTDKEIETVRKHAMDAGAADVATSDVWARGGAGGTELAEAVVKACDKPSSFKFLYPLDATIKEKMDTIAVEVYGSDGCEYSEQAEKDIAQWTADGFDKLPICMAKTHLSLSHDPSWKGYPKGYKVPIRGVRASVGAGFLYPLCGKMRTMPGLPNTPAGEHVDIDEEGKVVGLF